MVGLQKTQENSRLHHNHTMATLMLEGGVDIRFIQQMLGHSRLESTQIYTQVSIKALQEVHARTYPGVRISGKPTRS